MAMRILRVYNGTPPKTDRGQHVIFTTEPRTMHLSASRSLRAVVITVTLAWLGSSAMAGKPEWAGNGNGKKQKHVEESAVTVQVGAYFGDNQRTAAAEYYGQQRATGRCPPGLAKKNNGCMPPGQAKRWAMGHPLPGTVVQYQLPNAVTLKIGLPPAGYRYVRVANDILLIAIGTHMVVDAIEDLMKP
jgi:Ni/Co efflux regulator RcnB